MGIHLHLSQPLAETGIGDANKELEEEWTDEMDKDNDKMIDRNVMAGKEMDKND